MSKNCENEAMRNENEVVFNEKKVIITEKVPQGTVDSLMFISIEYHWQQFRKVQRTPNT